MVKMKRSGGTSQRISTSDLAIAVSEESRIVSPQMRGKVGYVLKVGAMIPLTIKSRMMYPQSRGHVGAVLLASIGSFLFR